MIYLLGVDMISGTPVIDIKPYIPQYDSPWSLNTTDTCVTQRENVQLCAEDSATELPEELAVNSPSVDVNECSDAEPPSSAITCDTCQNVAKSDVSVANWIRDPLRPTLSVAFTTRAEHQLKQFDSTALDANFKLRHLANAAELRSALTAVLQSDPRSVYRRKHCQDQLYYATVDVAHVTCWFDADTVQVLKLQSVFLLQNTANVTG